MRKLVLLGSTAIVGLVLGIFAGCGGGGGAQQPSETPTSSASGASSAAPAPPPSGMAWDDMNHGQRLYVMKHVVVPKMGADFKAFDAKKFDDFGCKTCHGKRAKEGRFKMPNPDLPHLSYTDNFKKHRDEKPEITKFMMDKVEPDMAACVGEKPFDPKTKTGFGCAECHIVGP
jgi:hypothetical protein